MKDLLMFAVRMLPWALVTGAVGYVAWWRGWSVGRQEEREAWSILVGPNRGAEPYKFENGRLFKEAW